jgi:hypothetical protein
MYRKLLPSSLPATEARYHPATGPSEPNAESQVIAGDQIGDDQLGSSSVGDGHYDASLLGEGNTTSEVVDMPEHTT